MARMACLLSILIVCVSVCSSASQPKIVGPGRVNAIPGEFPYFVYITDKSGNLITGGVLIRKRVVLTVGYNYVNTKPSDLTVVLGTFDRMNKSEPTRQEVGVTHITIHPEFIWPIIDINVVDMALMRLQSEPVRSKRVKPLGINRIVSSLTDDRRAWDRRADCVSPGYGLIDLKKEKSRTKLQKYVPVVQPPFRCAGLFNLKKKYWMCSLNEDRTAVCYGDGANPLLCKNGYGHYMLHGLASGGSIKCNIGFSRWTRLSPYITWIKRNAQILQLI